jgi:SAM-dependent methyltransferase
MPDLLLGCGSNLTRQIKWGGRETWRDLLTLDINPDHNPDRVWDIEQLPLPFDDDTFDEIHAYHVLEHVGRQGDWRFFFKQWDEFYRLLKPGGIIFGTSPSLGSEWLWGDPGHTRVVSAENFYFLSRPNYAEVGQTTMTDYRFIYQGDFDPVILEEENGNFIYGLQAIKPRRD